MLEKILDILKQGNDKILYIYGDKSLTYLEAYERVKEVSDCLMNQGQGPVVVYGHKSIEQFISILACIVAKRCYIPIDTCTPINRLYEIIKLSGAELLIKNENIDVSEIENVTLLELINKYTNNVDNYVSNNETAYVIFTSGSSGKAKGVPISYKNLNHFIEWIVNVSELKDVGGINLLSQASFSFDLSVFDIYFSIFKQCTIVAADDNMKKNINSLYDCLIKNDVNFLVATPSFLKLLLVDSCFEQSNFPNLEYMFFCGETLEVETIKRIKKRFNNIKVINAYGPTEATCCVSLLEIENKMLSYNYLPVGYIDTAAVKIDIENSEIVLKGRSVFSKYNNMESKNCYTENGVNCYKTGDIGYIEDGLLYCKGRNDTQVKYNGYRIELGDIENNLLKVNGVREAVVVLKQKNNIKIIKAFVTVDSNVDEVIIKNELKKIIPSYMIPKKIVILDEIPKNNSDKYDRRKLSEL